MDTLSDLSPIFDRVKIYILNNNSDYCVLNEIMNNFPAIDLVYIWDEENHGVSNGRNILLNKVVDEPIMILLDDDVRIPEPNLMIDDVLESFNNDKNLGALAFNIIDDKTRRQNRYEIPHKNKKINMNEDFFTYIIIGAGNAISIEKSREVGGFPQDFGKYGFEEIDLSFRLINQGYKIKYLSKVKIIHRKSPDGRFNGDIINYLYFVNRTKMAKRYFKKRYFLSCFFVRSLFFLFKTKNITLYIKALKEIFEDTANKKFSNTFYSYIKRVNGFIWY